MGASLKVITLESGTKIVDIDSMLHPFERASFGTPNIGNKMIDCRMLIDAFSESQSRNIRALDLQLSGAEMSKWDEMGLDD